MPPGYVKNLDDYFWWLEPRHEWSGGQLDNPPFVIRTLYTDAGREDRLVVNTHRLRWHGGTSLTFSFSVRRDLTLEAYSYDFRDARERLIWRKDNHPGHSHRDHIHKDPTNEDNTAPHREEDFQQVLDQITQYHSLQTGRELGPPSG